VPFTPFHLGPGAVFKAIGGRHVSFMVFGGSQVMMDIEPLVGIIRGSFILHGITHTLPGALVIGTLAGLIGRPISAWVLRLLQIPHYPFTWTASFIGAYLGTFSHVLLDALMHPDTRPWWPFSNENQLLAAISPEWLHLGCAITAAIGGAIVALRFHYHGRA
jgi:membrane-bound metal-dependent hydrolase YbcI (DUF457 family)